MGATSPLKKFRFFIKGLTESDHLPDYKVELTTDDQVIFRIRNCGSTDENDSPPPPVLSTQAYARARKYTQQANVYAWEQDWIQSWRDSGCPSLKSADAAFIGFCRARFVRDGQKGNLASPASSISEQDSGR